MAVKRRHFTSRRYTEEYSSSEESSGDGDDEEKTVKVPKIKEIKDSHTEAEGAKELYKVVPTVPVISEEKKKSVAMGSDDEERNDPSGSQSEGSSENSSSDSDTDSGSGSESSDEDEQPILKPVFVSKSKRESIKLKTQAPSNNKKENTLQKLQHNISTQMEQDKRKALEASATEREDTGGIDDTDNLDPEQEYEAWRQRELGRLRLQRDRMIAKEKEEEETFKRREQYDEGSL